MSKEKYAFRLNYMLFLVMAVGLLHFSEAHAMEITVDFEFARWHDRVVCAMRYDIPPDYHAYSHDPGGEGLPTDVNFTLENFGTAPVLYPAGVRGKDVFDPSADVNIYNGEILLLAVLPMNSADKMYVANISMLLCSDRRCVPVKQTFSGSVPATVPDLEQVSWQEPAMALLGDKQDFGETLSFEEGLAPPPITSDESLIKQKSVGDEDITAHREKADEAGKAILHAAEDFDLNLEPRYVNEELEIYSLGKALLMGLLAGLILNAMPCVLPVLTLKVSGLILMGNADNRQKLRSFRQYNISFAAGVLTFFTFLALLLGLADFMWGQLYQSQAVLLIMLLLVFLMGLSMLGVFTLPAFDLRLGENTSNPVLHAYFTGLVSTFLATPCSGPLLGGVLAWAFTQPLAILLAILWAVGLGMSLPYLAFSLWPNMAKILPRPGNWMYVFEHVLGFLLLGTALYLLSILPEQKHMQVLCVLLLIAMAAWLCGRFCGFNAPVWRRRAGGAICALLLAAGVFWVLQPARDAPQWQSFSPAAFAEDVGKKAMLVEFTADWCPNCKFLEASVLSDKNLRNWQKRYGMELVKVDLTRPDPYAEKLLEMLGSKSIPLTAIFPPGKGGDSPVVLRDIYGRSSLEKALRQTLGRS